MSNIVGFSRLSEAVARLESKRWSALFDIKDLRRLICDLAFEATFIPMSAPHGFSEVKDAVLSQEFRGPTFIKSELPIGRYVVLHFCITVQRHVPSRHPANHLWWVPRFVNRVAHTALVNDLLPWNVGTEYRLKLFIHPEPQIGEHNTCYYSFSQSLAMVDDSNRVESFNPSTFFLRYDQPIVCEIRESTTVKLLAVSHRDWTPS